MDIIFILSVGGGNREKNVSANLTRSIDFALSNNSSIVGIVGRDGGYTAKSSENVCIVPTINNKNVTPHTEAFHSIIWHAMVSHPRLKIEETKWESII